MANEKTEDNKNIIHESNFVERVIENNPQETDFEVLINKAKTRLDNFENKHNEILQKIEQKKLKEKTKELVEEIGTDIKNARSILAEIERIEKTATLESYSDNLSVSEEDKTNKLKLEKLENKLSKIRETKERFKEEIEEKEKDKEAEKKAQSEKPEIKSSESLSTLDSTELNEEKDKVENYLSFLENDPDLTSGLDYIGRSKIKKEMKEYNNYLNSVKSALEKIETLEEEREAKGKEEQKAESYLSDLEEKEIDIKEQIKNIPNAEDWKKYFAKEKDYSQASDEQLKSELDELEKHISNIETEGEARSIDYESEDYQELKQKLERLKEIYSKRTQKKEKQKEEEPKIFSDLIERLGEHRNKISERKVRLIEEGVQPLEERYYNGEELEEEEIEKVEELEACNNIEMATSVSQVVAKTEELMRNEEISLKEKYKYLCLYAKELEIYNGVMEFNLKKQQTIIQKEKIKELQGRKKTAGGNWFSGVSKKAKEIFGLAKRKETFAKRHVKKTEKTKESNKQKAAIDTYRVIDKKIGELTTKIKNAKHLDEIKNNLLGLKNLKDSGAFGSSSDTVMQLIKASVGENSALFRLIRELKKIDDKTEDEVKKRADEAIKNMADCIPGDIPQSLKNYFDSLFGKIREITGIGEEVEKKEKSPDTSVLKENLSKILRDKFRMGNVDALKEIAKVLDKADNSKNLSELDKDIKQQLNDKLGIALFGDTKSSSATVAAGNITAKLSELLELTVEDAKKILKEIIADIENKNTELDNKLEENIRKYLNENRKNVDDALKEIEKLNLTQLYSSKESYSREDEELDLNSLLGGLKSELMSDLNEEEVKKNFTKGEFAKRLDRIFRKLVEESKKNKEVVADNIKKACETIDRIKQSLDVNNASNAKNKIEEIKSLGNFIEDNLPEITEKQLSLEKGFYSPAHMISNAIKYVEQIIGSEEISEGAVEKAKTSLNQAMRLIKNGMYKKQVRITKTLQGRGEIREFNLPNLVEIPYTWKVSENGENFEKKINEFAKRRQENKNIEKKDINLLNEMINLDRESYEDQKLDKEKVINAPCARELILINLSLLKLEAEKHENKQIPATARNAIQLIRGLFNYYEDEMLERKVRMKGMSSWASYSEGIVEVIEQPSELRT